MGQIRDSRMFRVLVAFLLAATALLSGIYSILLFVYVFGGNGSAEGNGYVFTLALILLIFFPVALAFSVYYWKLRDVDSDNQSV
jgi:ABC-type polysaccharide/polyol phosphate export permease